MDPRNPFDVDGPIFVRQGAYENWYVIECARPGQDVSNASVEGTADQMREIAAAIDARAFYSESRCAVDARRDPVLFWSPRNSTRTGAVPRHHAEALAAEIHRTLEPRVEPERAMDCGDPVCQAEASDLRTRLAAVLARAEAAERERDAALAECVRLKTEPR